MTETTRRRETRQRSAVRGVLADVDDFRSAQQLHALLRERGENVGLATVYRTLQQLAEDGEVDVLRTGDGESVYRRCSTGHHHHHLTCRSCRRTVEVDSVAVERWARKIAADNGFADVEHVVEVFGTCAECARGQSPGRASSSGASSSGVSSSGASSAAPAASTAPP